MNAERLSRLQALAIKALGNAGVPVPASAIRSHDLWYAEDILDRLVNRGFVVKTEYQGGVKSLYSLPETSDPPLPPEPPIIAELEAALLHCLGTMTTGMDGIWDHTVRASDMARTALASLAAYRGNA